MTKREKILAVAGVVVLVAALGTRAVWLRATRVDWAESRGWFADYSESSGKGPRVILWYDSQYYPVKDAVRVDVREGVPHTRNNDGMPIRDLVSYVDAEVARTGAEYVVVTATRDEKIGGVMAVVDECRKTRVKAVLLNQYSDAFFRR